MSRTNVSTGTIVHNGMTRVRGWTTKTDGITVDSSYTITDRVEARTSSQFSETRTGTTSPGFWSPKRVTPLPYNAFTYERKEYWTTYGESHTGQEVGSGRIQHSWSQGSSAGNAPSFSDLFYNPVTVLSSAEKSSIDSQARNMLASKIKDEKVNLAQFYAEREQAVKMFVDTIERLTGAIRSLRKGDVISAAGHLGLDISSPRKRRRVRQRVAKSRGRSNAKGLADHWLALQFGWKPLLSDVAGIAETLAKSLNDIHYGKASHTVFRKTSRTDKVLGPVTNRYGGYDNVSVQIDETYVVKYEVRFHTTNALIKDMASIGITNPLSLAWELIPFSFVVDWFLPIGKFLENLDAYVGLKFDDGLQTIFVKQRRQGTGLATGWDANRLNFRYQMYGTSHLTWVKFNRTRLTSFPEVPYPELRNPFSATHIADSISLLVQHFK